MKIFLIYAAGLFLIIIARPTVACCSSLELYFVTNVEANDSLNVRQEPHPLAPVVTTLAHNQGYFRLNSYRDKREEMLRHNLCVTVSFSPFESNRRVSEWCQLRDPKGWVNMHYLQSCTVEASDDGTIINSQCDGVSKGKKLSDYY